MIFIIFLLKGIFINRKQIIFIRNLRKIENHLKQIYFYLIINYIIYKTCDLNLDKL